MQKAPGAIAASGAFRCGGLFSFLFCLLIYDVLPGGRQVDAPTFSAERFRSVRRARIPCVPRVAV